MTIREELGVNIALGASNVSYGLPDRELLNGAFIPMAIAASVTVPIMNAAKMVPFVLAADLSLGRDDCAKRYLKGFRQRTKAEKEAAAAAAKASCCCCKEGSSPRSCPTRGTTGCMKAPPNL